MMDVKQKLKEIALLTDEQLEKYWDEEINLNFGFNQSQKDLIKKMLLHAKEHNLRSAKRIRAAFVYYSYLLGNKEINEEIYKAMMAVELVHTALLMHDDVMDGDDLRRGQVTTHKYFENGDRHYGESIAYCLGDSVMALGYELILRSEFEDRVVKEAAIKLLRGITQTAYGQAFDVYMEKISDWKVSDVIALHSAKTAIYSFENPLLIGGILGKLDINVLDLLSQYSLFGGVAFQLQDDILGIFGDKEKTGKSNNSDLIHGKRTLLILKALEMGSEKQINDIKNIWGKGIDDETLISKAKQAIIDSGSLDYSKKLANEYAVKSVETIECLNNFQLNSEAIEFITGMAKYMVEREV